jgi:hypothetical protein
MNFVMRFISLTAILIISSSLIIGCGSKQANDLSSQSSAIAKTPTDIWVLAVLPFEVTGKSNLSGEEVMNLMVKELMNVEGFKIVDRAQFDKILEELGLSMSEMSDGSNRQKIGKLLGAQILCFGTLNPKANLTTARIVFTETSATLISVDSSQKNEVKAIKEIAQKIIADKAKITDSLSKQYPEPIKEESPSVTVEVTGYGAIVADDLITARELALKDAYAKAIEQGCGVKLVRTTQVENFQLVRDKVMKESAGFIEDYQIVLENPKGSLGYEVSVKAKVSKKPISETDKIGLMVKYLFAEPKVIIMINGESNGKPFTEGRSEVIRGLLGMQLQKAGFVVLDAKTIKDKIENDSALFGNDEAAKVARMLNADIIVRGNISTNVTSKIDEYNGQKLSFPMMKSDTTGTFEVIIPDTAEVVYSFSHKDLAVKPGLGTTEDGSIQNSIEQFIDASSSNLINGIASKMGEPIKLRLELRNAKLPQAEQFEQQIKKLPSHIVLSTSMINYEKEAANYEVKTVIRSQALQQNIIKLIDPTTIGAKEFVPEKIERGVIVLSLKN